MADPLLITAFGPFPGVPINPTQTLLASLATSGDPVLERSRRVLLPTEYDGCFDTLCAAITSATRAIVMLGYSAKAAGITLESRATSVIQRGKLDAAGGFGTASKTQDEQCETRLDLTAMAAELRQLGLPVAVSDDAGSYVCNHLYHSALSGPCGAPTGPAGLFIHLPALPGTELAAKSAATMPFCDMQRGLGVAVRHTLRQS